MSLKKQITISPDLLKGGGSSGIKKSPKEKKKPKVKINKPSKLKKEFLKRIKDHKNKIKNSEKEEDIAFSSDFKDSMNYLMDIMKDKGTKSNKGRTLKHRPIINEPNINLSLPTDLMSNEIKILPPSMSIKSPISQIVTPISPVVNPVSPVVNPVESIITPINNNSIALNNSLMPTPPYGILKNGSKPTYRMWLNKTQKNRESNVEIPKKEKTEREEKLNHLKEKFGIFSKPIIEKKVDKPKKTKSIIKKKYCTIKRKYNLGKNNTRRKISVLLKNKDLRARVQVERSMLRSKPLHVMKNYLYSHGILKVGNNAPKDLIKRIYEDAILTGEVTNTSKDVLIYNYLNKKDD
uniref:Uncharacterized protein n=1 Tax=viral metagenome TaxID=1070528 RepID=A0A6C0AX67_9ZZZZ|tara:strand:- start:6300 stop:7349 length:1050 start_codon:yes stop_codon:yes gene_type:complete